MRHSTARTGEPVASVEQPSSPFASPDQLGSHAPYRIVIVGGGAGGLVLAVRLGQSLRRTGAADVLLIDDQLTHFWKPLLHEVAAGTLPAQANRVDFLQQARRHHFRFHLGRMETLDRSARRVWLAPLSDDDGVEIAPRRSVPYDALVVAVGSTVNDFGTPGVARHASTLDDEDDARRFHRRLLAACARAEIQDDPVDIVIVGGGATGVELAAELHESVSEIASYGARLSHMETPIRLTLVEVAPRLLGALPEPVAERARRDLESRKVRVMLGQRVTQVGARHVEIADGGSVTADLSVWAAGIQGAPVLENLDGLTCNRLRRLVVQPTLQSVDDANVFAIGDCASLRAQGEGSEVPPTAQAAQQQAEYLARALVDRIAGRSVAPFRYRHRGTLVSLGSRRATGSLVPFLGGEGVPLYGLSARLAYGALQRRHLATLYGFGRAALITFGRWLSGRGRPRVKLH